MATIWKPSEQNELYHYGVIGMKWGMHRARKHQSTGNRLMARSDKSMGTPESKEDWRNARKHYDKFERLTTKYTAKAEAKLRKINASYEKRQARADRKFDKAERKSNSFLASERSAKKAFRKASKEQFRANKIAAKGKKWYDQMAKEYKKTGVAISKESQEIGKELVRQIRANSRAMYAANYAGRR